MRIAIKTELVSGNGFIYDNLIKELNIFIPDNNWILLMFKIDTKELSEC